MRENMGLYRGKRTDNGEWVEGYLGRDTIIGYGGKTWLGYVIREVPEKPWDGNWHEVDPDTIGECTGLRDKNGKLIFEGDIISTDLDRPYLIVEYRDACFMFNCNDGGKDYYDIFMPILDKPHTEYKWGEVIGNVHDNHEILKGGEGDG